MAISCNQNINNILHEYNLNLKWLQKNYNKLKQNYDKQWVLIEKQKITFNSSSYKEIIAVKTNGKETAIIEYIDAAPVAMFF